MYFVASNSLKRQNEEVKENLLPTFNQYILPNGMRIIHEPSASKVAYCGFAVDAGTRDELENEQGMAHFVEHLYLKVPPSARHGTF